MLDKTAVRQIAKRYADVVCEQLNPKTVILFGSYVNGNPHEHSDIDIAIIFDGYDGNWFDTAVLLQHLRCGIDDDSPAAIEPHLMDETSDPSGFLEHVKKTGEVIFEEVTPQEESKKTFHDIAKPLVHTRDRKFDREEANERR